jgi:hypothetical protein
VKTLLAMCNYLHLAQVKVTTGSGLRECRQGTVTTQSKWGG